jgi:hypothetical protein
MTDIKTGIKICLNAFRGAARAECHSARASLYPQMGMGVNLVCGSFTETCYKIHANFMPKLVSAAGAC